MAGIVDRTRKAVAAWACQDGDRFADDCSWLPT